MRPSPKPVILFLAANPGGTTHRALDREARAIQDELARDHRHHFVFETRWAVTPLDVLGVLRTIKPTVVHFAGQGSNTDTHGLVLHGRDDHAHAVPAAALERVFGVAGASVRLVVLNACYSAPTADALLSHVDYVVGMRGAISDEAARAFAIGFYGALAGGERATTAYEHGKAAIGLEVANGLDEADQPQLRFRHDTAHAYGALQQVVRALRANIRLGVHLTGPLGVLATGAVLVVAAMVACRAWFAFGESALDVRVQQLAVRADRPPPPVQDNGDVRAVQASAAAIAGVPAAPGFHRVALTGAFTSIDYGAGRGDPACRLRLSPGDDGVAIERAAPDGAACGHEVIVIAGPAGLALAVDDAPPAAIAPHTRLVLRMQPGTRVALVPSKRRLALFRPAHGVIWPVERVEGVSADDERVALPGALRRSDSFELDGAAELRELRFEGDRFVVRGALRSWQGRIGRSNDWDSAAPWPRIGPGWYAATGLAMLTLLVLALARARVRWRAWKEPI